MIRQPYANLLEAAETAHARGQHNEAIILAQTAAELFTEQTLRALYAKRKINYLKNTFENFLLNYNLGNSKVSRLYMALSEDPINQAPFWSKFIQHTELRNDLVHEGREATKAQSQASIQAVQAVIAHVRSKV